MSGGPLRIDREGHLAILTLARPPVNALGRDLVEAIGKGCEALAKDTSVHALIVAAEGKNFCAGADLKERQGMSEEDVRRWVPLINGAIDSVARLPFPTLAAVQGVAAGGGFELALACDLRILEEGGRVGLKETSLAIIPGAGGTQRLPRLIGPSRAKRWIFTAGLFTAREALSDGAVDRVVPDGDALDESRRLAAEILANGPVALRAAKRAVDEGFDLPMEAALEVEIRAYGSTIPTEDRREALAAFREKRAPVWKGR